jgi:hypothetical protein
MNHNVPNGAATAAARNKYSVCRPSSVSSAAPTALTKPGPPEGCSAACHGNGSRFGRCCRRYAERWRPADR